MQTLGLIRIHFVGPNYKSANKLIHALKEYQDEIIITIDDDQIYDKSCVSLLIESYKNYPLCIHAHWASMPSSAPLENDTMTFYKADETPLKEQNIPNLCLLPLGVAGVLYPPECLDREVFNMEKFLEIAPHNDDLWFYIMGILKDTQKVLATNALGHPKQSAIATFESPNLWEKHSIEAGEGLFAIELCNLLKAYPKAKSKILQNLESASQTSNLESKKNY